MTNTALAALLLAVVLGLSTTCSAAPEKDVLPTSQGPIEITFLKHATFMLQFGGKVIHVDPVRKMADYSGLPKADLILVTHEHSDHLDQEAIAQLKKPTTAVVLTQVVKDEGVEGTVLANGASVTVAGLPIRAVPAYNLVHLREPGVPFHPKGRGNGYVVTFGDLDLYIAGDTENTPEMKELRDITVAFLPMNLPYTMTPAMVADATVAFRPAILYPYHFGETKTAELTRLLAEQKHTEVRIRNMP